MSDEESSGDQAAAGDDLKQDAVVNPVAAEMPSRLATPSSTPVSRPAPAKRSYLTPELQRLVDESRAAKAKSTGTSTAGSALEAASGSAPSRVTLGGTPSGTASNTPSTSAAPATATSPGPLPPGMQYLVNASQPVPVQKKCHFCGEGPCRSICGG